VNLSLDGKTAIVTGGGRGLGRAMAQALYEAGSSVMIWDVLEDTEAILEASNSKRMFGRRVDLSTRSSISVAVQSAQEELGGAVDILVNNAGVQFRSPCEDFPIEEWDRILEVNLTAAFLLTQAFGRGMVERGFGKVINIASLMSFQGGLTIPAYAASKGGIAQLTKAFANEWASKGVNVNAIAPGYMDTPLNKALVGNPAREPDIMARIPAKRWGRPDDLKGVVVFLASSAADYIHGAVIPVDGGYLAR